MMHIKLRDRFLIALLSVMAIVGAGCGSQSSQTTTKSPLVVEFSFGEFHSFDPARDINPVPRFVDKNMYDTLVRVNPQDLSMPYPSLATSFTVSADGLTTTFQLRHGVTFASGNPFTSADVVWSLTRLANIKFSGAAEIVAGLTATATDPYTVVITSAVSNPAVAVELEQFQAGILDSKLVQQHGGTNDATDQADAYLNTNSAGSGPYMLVSEDRTSQVVLKANPRYWGGKPAYQSVILRNVPPATQRLDIQDGQAQLALDISPTDAASMDSSKVNVIAAPSEDTFVINLNANPSISRWSANENFRTAVKYAVDYKGIVALMGIGAISTTGLVPVGVLGALPAGDAPQQDIVQAKAYLAKAEADLGNNSPTIELEYYTDIFADGVSLAPLAAKIQSDLQAVGITVKLAGNPASVLNGGLVAGKLVGWTHVYEADFPDPSNTSGRTCPGDGHIPDWVGLVKGVDPSLEAVCAKADSATQLADRRAAFEALGRYLNTQSYTIVMGQAGRTLVAAKSVHAALNPFSYTDLGAVT